MTFTRKKLYIITSVVKCINEAIFDKLLYKSQNAMIKNMISILGMNNYNKINGIILKGFAIDNFSTDILNWNIFLIKCSYRIANKNQNMFIIEFYFFKSFVIYFLPAKNVHQKWYLYPKYFFIMIK